MLDFKYCTLLVLLFLVCCDAMLSPLTMQTEEEKSLRRCVNKITEQFTSNEITTIVYSFPTSENLELHYLGQILSSNKDDGSSYTTIINDVHVSNGVNYFTRFKHPFGFLIILETLEELNTTLPNLDMEYENNRFVILFQFPFKNSRNVIRNIMNSFLNKNKLHIQIILPLSSNTTHFVIYSWKQICGQRRQNIITYCSHGTFYNNTKLPYQRGPLDKCLVKTGIALNPPYTIKILKNDQMGIEEKLMETISSVSHLTVNYLRLPDIGNVYVNGVTTSGFHSLKSGHIDILFGGIRKDTSRTLHFKTTAYYLQSKIICCAPYVSYYNYDDVYFKSILNLPYIACIVVMLLTASLVIWCLSHQSHETKTYKTISKIFLNNWSILIGVAVHTLPKTSRVRLFMGLLCAATIALSTYNSSYLTSLLATAQYKIKYNDMEEVLNDNLTIYGSKYTVNHLQTSLSIFPDGIHEQIYTKIKLCPNETRCLDSVDSGNSAYLMSELRKNYLFNNIYKGTTSSKYCSQNAILSYLLGFYVRKGFSHLEEVNRMITRIFDVGLLFKWVKEATNFKKTYVQSSSAMIKMEHLMPVFKIYLVMNVLAVLVFLAELYIGRKRK